MPKHMALLACLLLSACATNDPGDERPASTPVKKRAEKPASSTPAKARPVAPIQTSPSPPVDDIAIVHTNRGKAGLFATVGGGLNRADVDAYVTQQVEEFRRSLQNEIQQGHVRIDQRTSDDAIRVSMTFATGFDNLSSVVKPGFLTSLNKIAQVLSQYNKTMLTVIAYVEQVGPDAGDHKLATRRAKSVSDYFISQQIHVLRLQSYSRNASPSLADGPSAKLQPMRRVDLWIQPVIAP